MVITGILGVPLSPSRALRLASESQRGRSAGCAVIARLRRRSRHRNVKGFNRKRTKEHEGHSQGESVTPQWLAIPQGARISKPVSFRVTPEFRNAERRQKRNPEDLYFTHAASGNFLDALSL